jgi:uncharacterized Fe-S cluster protein YjdI/CDGSH-type Zn-finger protein
MDDKRKEYTSERIIVSFERSLCIHTANCLRGLPQVFDLDARPWIAPAAADADDIAAVVERCPSGALQYRRLDGGPQEAAPDETVVFPIPNGPLFVRGSVSIVDADGRPVRESIRMTLCRCGQSSNKPYCDNTHRLVGFRTEDEPA